MRKTFTLLSMLFAFVVLSNAQSTYTFAPATYSSSTTNATLITYTFSNGCTISNNNTKAYSTGTISSPTAFSGIKFSAGTQYTITFPSSVSISNVTFTGYDNYAGKRSYFSEFNGVANTDTTQNFFTPKNVSAAVMSTVAFNPTDITSATTLTYTPAGNQIVSTFVITYTATTPTAIQSVSVDSNKPTNVYSIDGRRIKTNVIRSQATDNLKNGVYIIDNKKVVVNNNQ